ncbi:MAG: hypothetical protein IT326_03070 [Anaerolineae bacterium]|nr:hypothetical protein [Anaerolineae bacterium]
MDAQSLSNQLHGKRDGLTKGLALFGTLLAWLPLIAPVFFSAARLIQGGRFNFDYFMPAELFPAALLGGGLLIWAALRARSRRGLIAGGLAAAVVLLVGGQALAVATGLASGAIEPEGWPWTLVVASLAANILALIAVGVGGILLLRDVINN